MTTEGVRRRRTTGGARRFRGTRSADDDGDDGEGEGRTRPDARLFSSSSATSVGTTARAIVGGAGGVMVIRCNGVEKKVWGVVAVVAVFAVFGIVVVAVFAVFAIVVVAVVAVFAIVVVAVVAVVGRRRL